MKLKKYLLFYIILFIIIAFIPIGINADTNVILISNFDDIASGVTDTVTGYFDLKDMSSDGGIFQTSTTGDLSPPNSLAIYDVSNPYGAKGYMNLTTDFPYISLINFSFYLTSTNIPYMEFYDYLGNKLLFFKFDTSSDMDLDWYQVGVGWKQITTGINDNTRYYLTIEHNFTNNFHVTVLDSSFVEVGSDDVAGNYASTWTNFSDIYIYSSVSGGLYLDNFYVSLYQNATPSLAISDEYLSYCSGTFNRYASVFGDKYLETTSNHRIDGTVYGLDLVIGENQYDNSVISDYYMWINGIPWGNPDFWSPTGNGYYMRWYKENGQSLDNEYPIITFECVNPTSGLYTYWWEYGETDAYASHDSYAHDDSARATNLFLDGDLPALYGTPMFCLYYNYTGYNPDPIPFNYNTTFGTGNWLQFYAYDVECYYGVRSRPDIVFHLKDDQLETNSRVYVYKIFKAGTEYEVYTNYFVFSSGETSKYGKMEIQDFFFLSTGSYYMILYNTTNMGVDIKNIVNISQPITVCSDGTKVTIDNYIPTADSILPNIDQPLGTIVGMIITIFCLLIPFIVGGAVGIGTNFPVFVYAITGGMGIAVSTALGLFPTWLPFFIIAVGIIMAIVVYLYKGNNGGG